MRLPAWAWLVLHASVWLSAALTTPPALSAPKVPSVLVLSHESAHADRDTLQRLRQQRIASRGPDSGIDVIHAQIPVAALAGETQALQAMQTALGRQPSVVLALSMRLARDAQRLRPDLPLIFQGSADPVLMCLVDSLARPGRNATGESSWLASETFMAQALVDAYPDVNDVVVLVDDRRVNHTYCDELPPVEHECRSGLFEPTGYARAGIDVPALQAWAGSQHRRLHFVALCALGDFGVLHRWLVDAGISGHVGLVVPWHYLMYQHSAEVVRALREQRWPAVYPRELFLPLGGIVAVSVIDHPATEHRALEMVGRVLAGESPSGMPVEQPLGLQTVINVSAIREPTERPSLAALRRAARLVRRP
jgi:ABC-type uncharacterized transport system substrate-binding protein